MRMYSWLVVVGALILGPSASAGRADAVNCQALFAAHTLRHQANFAPWSVLPAVVQPYLSLHLVVRVRVTPGIQVPLDRLGLTRKTPTVPRAFVLARDGAVYALLAGDKYAVMAAAEELAHRYGADHLGFQIIDEPADADFVHLPLPKVTEDLAAPPWRDSPMTRDAVLVDVPGDRFAVAFVTKPVPRRAARVFGITWLTDEAEVPPRLRRNERFAAEVPGGVIVSGAAYAILRTLEPRPAAPELAAHLPSAPDLRESTGDRRRMMLDLVDPDSAWSVAAFLRDFTKAHLEYDLGLIVYHVWRALAPQSESGSVWRRVRAAQIGKLYLGDLESSDAGVKDKVLAVWRDLREAVLEKVLTDPADFDPRAYEPAPDDARDIIATLEDRYGDDSDVAHLFEKLWRQELDTDAPDGRFPAGTLSLVLNNSSAAADAAVVAAYAEFLRQRRARDVATAQTAAVDVVPTAVDERTGTFVGVTWPLADTFDLERFGVDLLLPSLRARFGVRLYAAGDAQRIFDRLYRADLHAEAPDFKFATYAAREAFYKNTAATNRPIAKALRRYLDDLRAHRAAHRATKAVRAATGTGLTFPIPPERDVSALTAREILTALRTRFDLKLSAPRAAQEAFDRLYEEDLGSPAPDFDFSATAARHALRDESGAAASKIRRAFARYADHLRRAQHERAGARVSARGR